MPSHYENEPNTAATGMGDAIAEPPRTELRRLVTRWRALAATWADIFPDRKYRMETCANELEAALAAQPAPGVGGVSELLEQLRSELAADKRWDYTEYEKGRIAEKERVISQLAALSTRPAKEDRK